MSVGAEAALALEPWPHPGRARSRGHVGAGGRTRVARDVVQMERRLLADRVALERAVVVEHAAFAAQALQRRRDALLETDAHLDEQDRVDDRHSQRDGLALWQAHKDLRREARARETARVVVDAAVGQ